MNIKEHRDVVFSKTNGLCSMCGIKLQRVNYKKKDFFSMDHLISKKNGGSDSVDNLFPLCKRCNSIKGHKDSISIGVDTISHSDNLDISRFIKVLKYEIKYKSVDCNKADIIKKELINILQEKISLLKEEL